MFDHDKLNFQVEKFPLSNTAVYISESTHEGYETIPSKIGVGLRRVDNKKPLAIVTDSYETVQ